MKLFLDSLLNSTKTSFQHLKYFNAIRPRRGLKEFDDVLTSPSNSFAAMKISNQLEQVFRFIDENGDGKISPFELSKSLLCLGHDKSRVAEEAEGMIRQVDLNGDGYIDLNEYMNVVVADDAEDIHQYNHHGFEDILMDVFLVFDSDKNGLISAAELSRVLRSLGFDHCGVGECRLMIMGVDKDGDGFVDFEEFKLMMMVSCD